MEPNQITNLLTILLVALLVILFVLVVVYVILLTKRKNKSVAKEKNITETETKNKKQTNSKENKTQTMFDFMEFEKIEDNMIIQKEKFKYIMVVECQGVNYDLMSGVEKNGVEEGFLQFLNTLRHPIQLYVQTRTVDLGSSINAYKERVSQIEADLYKKRQQYKEMIDSGRMTKQEEQKIQFELTKQINLYEYGKDVIADTEKMSLNKNILNKKYYVVIPYYPSDLGENEYDEYEIRSMAFSELYTRSQAVIRTLAACDVKGKILNTRELIELLYVAYNRDEAEDFGLDRALTAQYDKLYSTSEDIYNKKMRELDKIIEDRAVNKAVAKVDAVKSKKQREYEERESKMDALIDEMAKLIIQGNSEYIGKDIAEEAINDIEEEKNKEEEVKVDAKEKTTRKTTTRARTRKKAS